MLSVRLSRSFAEFVKSRTPVACIMRITLKGNTVAIEQVTAGCRVIIRCLSLTQPVVAGR